MWKFIKDVFTRISHLMKLEERLSILEKKIEHLEAPPQDIKQGLVYNKDWNYYENKGTDECFCPTCIGNGRRIPVKVVRTMNGEGWDCSNCKTPFWKF